MKKKYLGFLLAFLLPLSFMACSDNDEPLKPVQPPQEEEEEEKEEVIQAYQDEKPYANFFGYNVMNDAYLWKKEIVQGLNSWTINADPMEAVEKVRYKNLAGEDIDKWTTMTDSYTDMVGGVDGVSTGTYGWGLRLFYKEENSDAVVAFVTYTHPDSPAEKAGLKRGDVILEVNGKIMTSSNYYDALFTSSSLEVGIGKYLGDKGYSSVESTMEMEAAVMYEDPVLLTKVFDCDGKKVGYLAYTSFTFESSLTLYDVCKKLKQEGISELILDLRYNGGGYVFTESVLASMLAPEVEVKNKSVFQTEIWNDDYMAYFEKEGEDLNTYFETEYEQEHGDKTYKLSTSDANLGLNKIYALVTESSASASEAILVGLKPYMDIEIIGQQTHGKYCAGVMLQGKSWYQNIVNNYKKNNLDFAKENPKWADWEKYIADWGIYVMVSTYADKNGENPCMPDGLVPDVEANDYYGESYQLGDEREAMLNIALQRAGKTDLEVRQKSRSAGMMPPTEKFLPGKQSPLDGKLIRTNVSWKKSSDLHFVFNNDL